MGIAQGLRRSLPKMTAAAFNPIRTTFFVWLVAGGGSSFAAASLSRHNNRLELLIRIKDRRPSRTSGKTCDQKGPSWEL